MNIPSIKPRRITFPDGRTIFNPGQVDEIIIESEESLKREELKELARHFSYDREFNI